eukprot:gene19337-24716_t
MVPMSALTVQRGARGPRSGGGGERPAEGGAPAAPATPAASGLRPALAPASIRLQSGFIKVADAPASDNRAGPNGMPRMDREAFQNMSEEERQRFREMRRRQREQAGGAEAGSAAPAMPGASAPKRGREQGGDAKDTARNGAPGAGGSAGPNARREGAARADAAPSG